MGKIDNSMGGDCFTIIYVHFINRFCCAYNSVFPCFSIIYLVLLKLTQPLNLPNKQPTYKISKTVCIPF